MDRFHTPVLLQEVIEGLNVRRGKKYIDATLGGGGHGLEIVKRGGRLLGIDVDQEAIEYVKSRIQNSEFRIGKEIILTRGNFRDIGEIARANGFGKVAGIVFDLGVSLHQLTAGERGFSFQKDGPLDMRMDPASESVTAADLVNGLYENEMAILFEKFAEEKRAWAVARAICRARALKRIETTGELARIVEGVYFGRRGAKSAYAKASADKQVFQALRIAVNDELGNLAHALPEATQLLERGGRIAVISFHSLEDRIVKQFFKGQPSMRALRDKPIVPGETEIKENPRARSSKLRIYEKKLSL